MKELNKERLFSGAYIKGYEIKYDEYDDVIKVSFNHRNTPRLFKFNSEDLKKVCTEYILLNGVLMCDLEIILISHCERLLEKVKLPRKRKKELKKIKLWEQK